MEELKNMTYKIQNLIEDRNFWGAIQEATKLLGLLVRAHDWCEYQSKVG